VCAESLLSVCCVLLRVSAPPRESSVPLIGHSSWKPCFRASTTRSHQNNILTHWVTESEQEFHKGREIAFARLVTGITNFTGIEG